MRSFLVLTISLAFALVGFYSRPSLAQDRWQNCTDGPPPASDFPEAAPTCKNKKRLEPWLGTPDVVFTLTGRCVLSFAVCGGKTKCYKSEVRDLKTGFCNDYLNLKERIARRTICCDPKCEKPTPWFDGLSPDPKCKDRQPFQTSDDGKGVVFLKMCGWNVFAHELKDKDVIQAYKAGLLYHVRRTVGSTVCCDSFNAAARPGSSCDPRFDLDCDGTSNATDTTSRGEGYATFPDISTFAIGAGVPARDTDPLPPWFQPGDKGFMPAANLCDCKWELMKGTRTCSPDGKRPHVYQIRWRCPSTGNEKSTRKEAPATEPCGPEAETMRSIFHVPDRQYINGFSYSFLGSLRQDRTRVLQRCATNPASNL